jgi:hypothetical protein
MQYVAFEAICGIFFQGRLLRRLQGDLSVPSPNFTKQMNNFEQIDNSIEQILANGNVGARSRRSYEGKVNAFRAWAAVNAPEGHQDIDVITNQSVMNICRYMLHYRDSTGNKYSSYEQLRTSLVWYYKHNRRLDNNWNSRDLTGNPAIATDVMTVLKNIQRDLRDTPVKRSQPLDYDGLGSVIEQLKSFSSFSQTDKLKYAAIFSLAWYCWLRIDEVKLLKWGDLLFLNKNNRLNSELNDGATPLVYSKVRLPFRKTDQNGTGTEYELHDDLNEPNVMVNSHITAWSNHWYIYFNSGLLYNRVVVLQ